MTRTYSASLYDSVSDSLSSEILIYTQLNFINPCKKFIMYGQYGQSALFGGYDGYSSQSESLSFPGANSKSKKKRVPLLGKMQRTSQPVPILPLLTALKDMAEDERIGNTHADDGSDLSLMSTSGDLSRDRDIETTPRMYSFPQYSDKKIIKKSEGQLPCNTQLQLNLKLTNGSTGMHEPEVFNELQVCPEELENVVPEFQAVDQISEAYKINGYVDNPKKDFLLSQKKDSSHNKYQPPNSLSTNPQQEKIVNNYNSSNDLDTFLDQKGKAVVPFLEEVRNSSALCVEKEEERFDMGPPLMCSSVKTNKGVVLRNIINHKDILNSKIKSIDVRGNPKIVHASEENLKQTDINYITNKENDVGLFALKAAAFNDVTPERNIPSNNKFPVFDSSPLNLSKDRGFQISSRRNVIMEKQMGEKLEGYAPSYELNMMENTRPLDNIKHVKGKILEDGKMLTNSVGLNFNEEKDCHSPARKHTTTEKEMHHPELHGFGYASLHKLNVEENTPSFDDIIPVKEEHEISKGGNLSGSLNKPNAKTAQKYSSESKNEIFPVSTQGTSSVERTVVEQEGLNMQQSMQSKAGLELVYKQNQYVAVKPVQRLGNCITVNGKSYKVQKILGRGGSSQVFEVLDPNTTQELAVKCVHLSVAEPSIAQGYLNEIALLRRLQGSETVIRMTDFEYAEEKQMLYVIMEKGETDLSTLIKKISKTNQIPIVTVIYYWVEMLRAVKNIHANNIIHSDLKPANFLLVGGRLKLIDFGIASSVQSDMTSVYKEAQAGTFNYMSPEAIQATHSTSGNQSGFKISYKSDIWSLGCILYNLLYGKTPFQHIVQPWAKAAAITNPGHTIDYPKSHDCPPVLLKAVQLCLTYDPKKRPTAAELLELPYINYNIV